MKKSLSLQFDTTRNKLFSILKLLGLSFAGLIILSLALAPFVNTEVDKEKDEETEERQEEASTGQESINGEQQADRTNPSSTAGNSGEDGSAGSSDSENITGAQSASTEETDTADSAATEAALYRVIKVVDGDTIDVSIAGQTERIRIIGLDTPETVDPRQTVECFGLEASAKAKELLLNQQVRLEADSTQGERGTFGRLLRYVFLADGRNYALEMIKQGYGHEYTYNVPHKHQQAFQQAEKEARDAERGLWAPGACADQETEDSESAGNNNPSEGCHPAYEPCLPIVDDLNCGDVDGPITVKNPGVDPYRLDRDSDGTGCESS